MFAWCNSITDGVKRNIFVYLLQRYLGCYFQDKISSQQLTVDLTNGTATLENISLDVQELNKLGEKQNWPLQFVDGKIEKINILVPYTAPLKQQSSIEIDGLTITVQPKQRIENVTSMFESMWNSMTSSMQLAEECAKQEESCYINNAAPYEGIQMFANAIDSILSKVNVSCKNITIRMEHLPQYSSTGVGLVLHIDEMQYYDESANDPTTEEATDLTNQDKSKAYLVQSYTCKKISIVGVSFSTVEFSRNYRTFSPSVMTNSQFLNADGVHRHEILFGKLSSTQEIRIRLKQSEQIQGPKVSIETNLGAFLLFLSPRQVHVLLELANGIACPDLEDTSNLAAKSKLAEKPMSTSDYQRIEQELQHNLHNNPNIQPTGLQGAHGWSTAPLDDSDSEDQFMPIRNTTVGMCDSTLSGHSSSMDSSINSSMVSSMTDQSHRTRKRSCNIDTDPRTEISHFYIRLASMAAVLIHEDLLMQSSNDQVLVLSTVRQLKKIADDYFDDLKDFSLTAFGARQFEDAEKILDDACKLNHLRLLAAPVQLEGDEKTTMSTNAFSISGHVTIAKLELQEIICETEGSPVQHVPLLRFTDAPTKSINVTAKPHFTLTLKHVDKTIRNGLSSRNSGRKTIITINLQKCLCEVDLTILDRISALLNPQPVCLVDKSRQNLWNVPVTNQVITNQLDSRLEFQLNCEAISVKLRFPFADYRPLNDMSRIPWFKRNVRSDYMILALTNVLIQTSVQSSQQFQEYELLCQDLNIYYHESENSESIHVAKSGADENYNCSINDLLKSRLSIKIYPVQKSDLDDLNKPEQDIATQSMCAYFVNQNKLSAPFSSIKVVHESDTPHPKTQKDDAEELVIPGDKDEIENFIQSALSSSQMVVDISLPTLSMQLIDKHTYELIYNRINNDLLLWKPSAPQHKPKLYDKSVYTPVSNNLFESSEVFKMCKSGIQYESDSDSNDSDEAPTIFYSTYDSKMRSSIKPHPLLQAQPKSQNAFTLNLHIGQGLVYMNTPVRDASTKVIPGQHGEFLLNVENASVFIVSGYNGDENLGYVCVQVHDAKLHHCDMISTASSSPPIKEIGTIPGRHLHPTIYKSYPGMLVDTKCRGGDREMLTVAVRIMASHETHHVKTVLVAIGLNKATLSHKMCNEPNSFVSHIIDFFNVQDYPIPGYVSKDVITEFHLHLWDCAIDYRPLHIPLRSAVTVGNFTMSSHLSAAANTSTLIFIAEECGLYLSDKAPPKSGVPSTVLVDLKRDYINVIELGLFELSLKTCDKKNTVNPHFDLRASNNMLNIRTCADSGKALMQLIKYYASNGDLTSISESFVSESSTKSSPRHIPEQELVSLEPQHISNLSISQHNNVRELIGDALKETEPIEEGQDVLVNNGTKIFFFPDENQITELTGKPLPQVTFELGDTTHKNNRGSDTDDDFCIVGNEAGLGIFPSNGQPDIKWLTSDPVRVIDNHFGLPTGKTDLLRAPKHFPNPVERYTLCEMTILWNMYGGHDFVKTEDNTKKKTVNFKDAIDKVSFQKTNVHEEPIIKSIPVKKKSNMSWIEKGGSHRDHSVRMELHLNKVRFQHELYPEHTKQASRQVLIISDVEITDRLESSQINKFLYQYTSQAKPKQSHAHMVVIKAIHERQDQQIKAQECCLKISLLPLRLNIDQDSLLFLINFFTELTEGDAQKDDTVQSKHNTPTHQPPVMMVNEDSKDDKTEDQFVNTDDNYLIQLEEKENNEQLEESAPPSISSCEDSAPVYFRKVTFSPDVLIRLDYQGKYVDMSRGPLAGILMGLGHLNKSELRLKRIDYRHGLLGFDKLVAHLLQEWLNEIRKNQVPSLLRGVGPMHSFVQLFQGIRDLFWLPIEQYQKDGRIVRGLQRGANSFTTSTAMAALELTSRIIHLIQITAETAYDMLSPGPSIRRLHQKSKGRRKRYQQPQDIREGMTNAIMVVKEGIAHTAGDIVQVASHEHEQKGYSGAVGSVLRQLPPTMLKPIILATEATTNLIEGARSQLEPDARKEAFQKWRSNDG